MPGAIRPRDKRVYKGSIALVLIDVNKRVNFVDYGYEAMPSADYDIYFKNLGGVQVSSILTQDAAGFTIGIGLALARTIDWAAVEIVS